MSNFINIVGLLKNLTSLGFKPVDCICEFIDNSIDANATCIKCYINPDGKLIFVDNAEGMDKQQLILSRTLFDRKDAKEDKIGRFGTGLDAACATLTDMTGTNIWLSKKEGMEYPLQLTIDYDEIVIEGKNYHPIVSTISLDTIELWKKYAISRDHGTLGYMKCPQNIIDTLFTKIEESNLGRKYHDYIQKGNKIIFYIDEKEVELISEDVMDLSNATYTNTDEMQVWKHLNGSIIVLFKNGRDEFVQVNKNTKHKYIQNKINPSELDYSKIGLIKLTHSVKFVHHASDNWKEEDGGLFLKRAGKIIDQYKNVVKNIGDLHIQHLKRSSRHVCEFSVTLDSVFGVEVNKSRLNKENIDKYVIETITYLQKEFYNTIIDKLKKNTVQPSVKLIEPDVVSQIEPHQNSQVHSPSWSSALAAASAKSVRTVGSSPITRTVQERAEVKQPANVIQIPTHNRTVSQSQRDLILATIRLRTILNSLNLEEKLKKASTTTVPGISTLINSIADIEKRISE